MENGDFSSQRWLCEDEQCPGSRFIVQSFVFLVLPKNQRSGNHATCSAGISVVVLTVDSCHRGSDQPGNVLHSLSSIIRQRVTGEQGARCCRSTQPTLLCLSGSFDLMVVLEKRFYYFFNPRFFPLGRLDESRQTPTTQRVSDSHYIWCHSLEATDIILVALIKTIKWWKQVQQVVRIIRIILRES